MIILHASKRTSMDIIIGCVKFVEWTLKWFSFARSASYTRNNWLIWLLGFICYQRCYLYVVKSREYKIAIQDCCYCQSSDAWLALLIIGISSHCAICYSFPLANFSVEISWYVFPGLLIVVLFHLQLHRFLPIAIECSSDIYPTVSSLVSKPLWWLYLQKYWIFFYNLSLLSFTV